MSCSPQHLHDTDTTVMRCQQLQHSKASIIHSHSPIIEENQTKSVIASSSTPASDCKDDRSSPIWKYFYKNNNTRKAIM